VLGGDDEYQNRDDSFWEDLIHDADLNEDGQIDYNEFLIIGGRINCQKSK